MAKGLSEKEMFCLDAWMSNGNSVMAYLLSRNNPPKTDNAVNLSKMASRWLNDPRVTEYINSRRSVDYSKAEEVVSDKGNRSRADAVEELNALISATKDPKIKGDLLLKLADLNKWKQSEDIAAEDKRITFYIPLWVDRCRELFAYHLKNEFGWTDEEQERAIEIMERAMHNTPGNVEKQEGNRPA